MDPKLEDEIYQRLNTDADYLTAAQRERIVYKLASRRKRTTIKPDNEISAKDHQDFVHRINKNQLTLQETKPITKNQSAAFDAYDKGYNLFLHGCPGTGKTRLLLYFGLYEVLVTKQYSSVTIVRSTVEGRKMGFLPGSPEEKALVFETPYTYLCSKLFNNDKAYSMLKNREQIKFVSTAFLRGTTFEDTFIIGDETQNLEWNELLTLVTRPGDNTKLMLAGDYKQSDFRYEDEREGFINFMKVIKDIKEVADIEFDENDIVRGGLVKSFIVAARKHGLL